MLTALTYLLILIVIVLAVASLWNPGLTLGLMWSMYALEQMLQRGNDFLLNNSSMINIVLTCIALVTVIRAMTAGRYRHFRVPREVVALLALYGMTALSYYWSISQKDTAEQLLKYWPYLIAFGILTPLCATDDRQVRLAVNVTIWFGGLILVGHALSIYGIRGVILDSFRGRSLEANPLAVATYAGYVGICAVFASYGQRLNLLSVVRLAIMLLTGWMIIRSGSRGQLLALGAVCVVWLPITTRATMNRSTVVALLIGAVLGFFFIQMVEQYEWSGRWSWDKIVEARQGRWQACAGLLGYWANEDFLRWMFGLGNSSSFRIVGFYPHNSPIEVLCEEGIVGLAIFGFFVLSVGYRGLIMMYQRELPLESRINLGVLLAMFSYEFILSLKQGSLLGDSMLISLGATIALLMVLHERGLRIRRTQKTRAGSPGGSASRRVGGIAGPGPVGPSGRSEGPRTDAVPLGGLFPVSVLPNA